MVTCQIHTPLFCLGIHIEVFPFIFACLEAPSRSTWFTLPHKTRPVCSVQGWWSHTLPFVRNPTHPVLIFPPLPLQTHQMDYWAPQGSMMSWKNEIPTAVGSVSTAPLSAVSLTVVLCSCNNLIMMSSCQGANCSRLYDVHITVDV